jgi:hypothetical protein
MVPKRESVTLEVDRRIQKELNPAEKNNARKQALVKCCPPLSAVTAGSEGASEVFHVQLVRRGVVLARKNGRPDGARSTERLSLPKFHQQRTLERDAG